MSPRFPIGVATRSVSYTHLLWGVNYDAAPLAERLELDVKPRGIEELYSLTAALQEHANALAARVVRDETGAMALPSFADTAGLVAQGWRRCV